MLNLDATICPENPLCVDLDGTLVFTDTPIEYFLSVIAKPKLVLKQIQLRLFSRASRKVELTDETTLNPVLLPYNTKFVDFLIQQKNFGRKIVLVTTANERIARSVADHLGIFDAVVTSSDKVKLQGLARADELVRRFGRKGFDYAGNGRADLHVWRAANGIVIVNAADAVANAARRIGTIVAEFPRRALDWASLLRAMRLYQWVKNLLVFVPLLTSQAFTDWQGLAGALIVFFGLCATASGIYILNDLVDLEADRNHPRKRNRPFASGVLPIGLGVATSCVLILAGVVSAVPIHAAHIVLMYAALSFTYSIYLKHFPLTDVFLLAALYTLRIVAGGIASNHLTSLWLLAFSGFTFLSLALIKRCAELPRTDAPQLFGSGIRVRGYFPSDRSILAQFGVAATFASSVVLALFVSAMATADRYLSPELLWGLVPLILFWQCRLWLSVERGYMHDDPIIYAFRDWVSWIVGMMTVAIIVVASRMT